MPTPVANCAVLSGDIVSSTELGAERLDQAMAALAGCAALQADWHGQSLRFSRNRGDGWQVLLARPELALRSALAFRAAIRALGRDLDSYMAVAVGRIDGPVPVDLNLASGPAFGQSGATLDRLKATSSAVRINIRAAGALSAAFILADHVSKGWTVSQARAIGLALDPIRGPSHTDMARRLGKSRQAVSKSLEAAGEKPITLALSAIERGAPAGD